MAVDQGTPNKKFSEEMRRHRLAWTPGTPEYAMRKDYPGAAAREFRCENTRCLNYWWQPVMETYWLCEECCAICPDTVRDYFTHAPYAMNPPKKKRRAACSAAFAAWAKTRKREPRPASEEAAINIDRDAE